MSESPGKKPSKSHRKISMPWFRQSSFGMSLSRLRLPKQHTIATSDADVEEGDGKPRSAREEEAALLEAIRNSVSHITTALYYMAFIMFSHLRLTSLASKICFLFLGRTDITGNRGRLGKRRMPY